MARNKPPLWAVAMNADDVDYNTSLEEVQRRLVAMAEKFKQDVLADFEMAILAKKNNGCTLYATFEWKVR